MMWLYLVAIVTISTYLYNRWQRWHHRFITLPPGPAGWPLIGNTLDIDFNHPRLMLDKMNRWGEQFGGVYTLSILDKKIVVVSCVEGMQECLVTRSNDFAGRPTFFRLNYLLDNTEEIVASQPTKKWEILKKSAMHGLKTYGDGLDRVNSISIEILSDLCNLLEQFEGKELDINDMIHDATTAIITSLTYGKKLSPEEIRETVRFDELNNQCMMPAGPGMELDIFPWLRHIPFLNVNFKRIRTVKNLLTGWYGERVQNLKRDWNKDNIAGVMDYMIKQQKELLNQNNEEIISDKELQFCQRDLIGAGIMTTSRALYAGVLLLIKHPKVEEIAYKEIEAVIGKAQPSLYHRSKCPYIEAMVLEILRYITHATIAVPHETITDTKLMGYAIPKGTQIWTDYYTLHHRSDLWVDPYKFKPERFLDDKGELVLPDNPIRKQLFLFGAGRRVCVGENLTRNRMFLFFAMVLQRFHLEAPDSDLPDCDPRSYLPGIVLSPLKYKLKIRQRDS